MPRRLLFIAALLLVMTPRPASAQIIPTVPTTTARTCSATVAGKPVSEHGSARHPIHIRYDATVRVEGQSASRVSEVHYKLKVAGRSVNFGEDFTTDGQTWSGEVSVKKYAWAGVGLYEVVGFATTDAGVCKDHVFICIDGKSPFATAAGGAASVAGLGGLALLGRTLARRRTFTKRPNVPLAVGGGLAGAGGVVLAQQMCILPLTPLTMSIIPIGAVVGVIIGIAFGIGVPVVYSATPTTPPVTPPQPPEQPRTEAKHIYQFRAPSSACTACKNHAMNKVFASAEVMQRAHKGCRCTIDWRPIDQASYTAYFRGGPVYDPRQTRP